jgi:hypothetical protein
VPPDPETRKAALPGGPVREFNSISETDTSQDRPTRQAIWLAARFGLGVEIAATIANLAFSVAR